MARRVEGCPFCAIANGEQRADKVYEDATVVCFLAKTLNCYGHTLVVPKSHYETVWGIDLQTLVQLMAVVQELSQLYRSRLNATGFNLLNASGKDAQQSVAHFHLHLLPRFAGDGLNAWPPLPEVEVNRPELMERLRPSRS